MKLFRVLNTFFIHDADEKAPISDYLYFYGLSCVVVMCFGIFVYKIAVV